MENKVAIFMVCAIVVQISLANLSIPRSDVQDEAKLDFSILATSYTLINLRYEKAIQRIFTLVRLGYLMKASLRNDAGTEECVYTTQICEDRILDGFMGAFNGTLEVIPTTSPNASAGILEARIVGYDVLYKLVDGICSAIELALGESSSDTVDQIEIIADAQVSATETLEAAYFAALLNGQTIPVKIDAAVATARSKATRHTNTGIRQIFSAIIAFVEQTSSEGSCRAGIEDVYSAIETTEKQVRSEFNAHTEVTIDLIQTLAAASHIIQTGSTVDCSAIEPIDTSTFFDHNKTVDSNSPSNTNEVSDVFIKNQTEILAKFCEIQAARRDELNSLSSLLESVFGVVNRLYSEIGNGNPGQNKEQSGAIDAAKNKTLSAFISGIDANSRGVQFILEESSAKKKIQQVRTNPDVKQVVNNIYKAIELSNHKDSTKIVHQMEDIEKEVVSDATSVMERIPAVIQRGRKINSAIEPAFTRAEDNIISEIVTTFENVMTTIKIFLAAVFRDIQFGIECNSSALETAQNEANSAFTVVVYKTFSIIETFYLADSFRNNTEFLWQFAAIQSLHERRTIKSGEGFNTIFTTIQNIMKKVSRPKHEFTDNDERELETAGNVTYASFMTEIESMYESILIINPEASSIIQSDRNATYSMMRDKVNYIYAAIKLSRSSDSHGIKTKLQTLRNAAMSASSVIMAGMYTIIQNSGEYSAETLAACERAGQNTRYELAKVESATFDAIEILLGEVFPGSFPSNKKGSSAIKDLQTQASAAINAYVTSFTGVLDILITVSAEIDVGLTADSCPAFYQLLESNKWANNTLMGRQVTVFAPTNKAFQKYVGSTEGLVLYHMCNYAQTTDEFELRNFMTTDLMGGPPVWITRKTGGYRPEIYINNAKVLIERSNYHANIKSEYSDGPAERQVLHVIDEVLEPVRSNPTAALPIYNPDAFQFLNQSENLNLGPHRVRNFRQRVSLMRKEHIFRAEGRYTFFIPVDEGFKPATRSGKVDEKVIEGHVISGHVLFTAPTPNDKAYKTLTFSDNIKVTVSFITEQDGKDTRIYVKSDTIVGDNIHAAGVVLAEIVKANIPVLNGVVHLIQRPLMVVDTTVTQFLEDKEDGPVYKFYEAIMDVDKEFMADINRQREVTLFAPSNAAWEEHSLQAIRQDKKRMLEILKLHYVKERLPLEKIVKNNKNTQVNTAAERKSLYFNIVQGPNGNETITVEGGGVNATVITPNIAATNGIIHIIDRVLGVPYTTIQEKLRTDPMLNSTYFLGQRQGFNNQLNDTKKRFTYFVPRDYAWQAAEIKYPSTYKKLFMPEFAYHAESILQRHVVVADQAYTMAKLKEEMHSNDTIILPALRGTLKLRVKESGESYFIEWQNEWIRVFRPDVECTNGIIHVIDSVLLKDSDVRVTAGSGSLVTFAPHIVMILIAKWLL